MTESVDVSERRDLEEVQVKGKLSLRVLDVVRTSQSENGLRHKDYMRYRQYCSRRLARIRKSLGISSGKVNTSIKSLCAENATDNRYLLIPLVNAERAWSYAMQLKQDLATDEERGRKLVHLRSRLMKAHLWSEKLLSLCVQVADAMTILEAEGYSTWMHGNLLLEKNMLQDALEKFNRAKTVYSSLAEVGHSSQKELYLQKIASIEPSIRYCQYFEDSRNKDKVEDVGIEASDEMLKSKIAQILEETLSREAQALDHVSFNGVKIPIKNESLRLCLHKISEEGAKLRQLFSKVSNDVSTDIESSFAVISTSFEESESIASKELSELLSHPQRNAFVEQQEDLNRKLLEYLEYQKNEIYLQRNLFLSKQLESLLETHTQSAASNKGSGVRSKPTKPDDLVSLYDRIIHNVESLYKLATTDEKPKWNAEVELYKTSRLYFRGVGYCSIQMWPEAYVLMDNVIANSLKLSKVPSVQAEALKLYERARGKKAFAHAKGVLCTLKGKSTSEGFNSTPFATTPVLNRLDSFEVGDPSKGYNLITYPPEFLPTACKPMLYDLAWDSVEFPDLSTKLKEKSSKRPGLGLFSFWGGK